MMHRSTPLRTLARTRLPLLALLALPLAACEGGGEPVGDPLRFTVPEGSGLAAVTDTLVARGIVDSPRQFRWYARREGADRALQPGVYEARRGEAWSEILRRLTEGDVVKGRLVIPEGWTAQQIAQRVADVSLVTPDSVLAVLADPESAEKYEVPGPTLEGYLYPATYEFPLGTAPEEVIGRLVRRYEQAWTDEMRARAEEMGLSEREVVTLASIIEKEAKVWEERPTISAVYHNRLRIGMRLQADPTVQYALGEHQRRLLYAHIDEVADNPYNTYRHAGLPPGPIASPSAGALKAALDPADVDYLYFVARPDGSHVFTRTLAEHNRAKNRSRREAAAARQADGE